MGKWRDQKRKMLADVHQHFEVAAVYLTHAAGTPIPVKVRLHQKQIVEKLPGDFSDGASMLDLHDRIVFEKQQLPAVPEGVLKDAFVIFGPSEAYRTGASKPEREGYIYCEVSAVSQVHLDALIGNLDLANPAYLGVLS